MGEVAAVLCLQNHISRANGNKFCVFHIFACAENFAGLNFAALSLHENKACVKISGNMAVCIIHTRKAQTGIRHLYEKVSGNLLSVCIHRYSLVC